MKKLRIKKKSRKRKPIQSTYFYLEQKKIKYKNMKKYYKNKQKSMTIEIENSMGYATTAAEKGI